ncbi:MAG: hypothetical protein FWE64_02980 [Alphaproteobacteria bacterium]|nr:hypothetical protein [Alphaproteobacteria bacterium]
MKKLARIFALCLLPLAASAMTQNQHNQMMTARGTGPTANFGNCDALIQRCAAPRCAGGACANMQVAVGIVNGCVMASEPCRGFGDALVQSIAAQMVASATVRANEAGAQQAAAADAAAAQQMQMMQAEMVQQAAATAAQMQQMQAEMARAQAESAARVEQALVQQAEAAAAAQAAQMQQMQPAPIAHAAPVQASPAGTIAAQVAAANEIAADAVARAQLMGMINTELDNVRAAMRTLDAVMQTTFTYAGCDQRGDNCTGPRRVARFRQHATGFFDPFDNVLDRMLTALELAQALGMEVADIYMMLSGSCNRWGMYWCDQDCVGFDIENPLASRMNPHPRHSDPINESSCNCRLVRPLGSQEEVIQSMLDINTDSASQDVRNRVGCMSTVARTGVFARHAQRRNTNALDIRALELMVTTDPSSTFCMRPGTTPPLEGATVPQSQGIPDCKINANHCSIDSIEDMMETLRQITQSKNLPPNACISRRQDMFNVSHPPLVIAGNDTCTEGLNAGTSTIHPVLALCSVHAWNVGKIENPGMGDSTPGTSRPDTTAEREQMNEVIKLKSTVITQQMHRQYEMLNALVRQFETQLRRAALANNDASREDRGNLPAGRTPGVVLAGARNCATEWEPVARAECIIANTRLALNAPPADARRQLEIEYRLLNPGTGTGPMSDRCGAMSQSSATIQACANQIGSLATQQRDEARRTQNRGGGSGGVRIVADSGNM